MRLAQAREHSAPVRSRVISPPARRSRELSCLKWIMDRADFDSLHRNRFHPSSTDGWTSGPMQWATRSQLCGDTWKPRDEFRTVRAVVLDAHVCPQRYKCSKTATSVLRSRGGQQHRSRWSRCKFESFDRYPRSGRSALGGSDTRRRTGERLMPADVHPRDARPHRH